MRPTSGRDLLLGLVVYGHGIARYIDTLSGVSADLGVGDSGDDVTALPALGLVHGLHASLVAAIPFNRGRWLQRHRQHRRPAVQRLPALALRVGQSALESRGSLNVGVEYLYGTHAQRTRPRAREPGAVCRQVPTCSWKRAWEPSRDRGREGSGIRDQGSSSPFSCSPFPTVPYVVPNARPQVVLLLDLSTVGPGVAGCWHWLVWRPGHEPPKFVEFYCCAMACCSASMRR